MEYIYIYNFEQAYFYIENGVRPLSIDKHNKTGNIYFKFNKETTRKVYDTWVTRDR